MKNKKYFILVIFVFSLFEGILLHSYIYKLGYLNITTNLFFVLTLIFVIMNVSNNKKNVVSIFFRITLFILFLFALLNKYFRVYIILCFLDLINMDAIIFINIMYVTSFVVIVALFNKYLIKEYIQDTDWIRLLITAILMKAMAVCSNFFFHDIAKDYSKLFLSYFFPSSFLFEYNGSYIK